MLFPARFAFALALVPAALGAQSQPAVPADLPRVRAVLDRVKAQGHQVIDEAPRPGSRGTTVAFVHPKTAFGTLIELVEE